MRLEALASFTMWSRIKRSTFGTMREKASSSTSARVASSSSVWMRASSHVQPWFTGAGMKLSCPPLCRTVRPGE